MLRFIVPALLAALAAVQPAAAQDSQDDSGGMVPQHGNSQQVAIAAHLARLNAPEQVKVNCWKLGCVLIVNETAGYDVVGFYLNSAKPGKSAHWSPNQLDTPLQPSRATLRFKTGNPDTCTIPVRFVLRRHATRERAEIEGTTSFCTSPHNDTLIRIKMLEGKVLVRGDDEPDPAETH